MSITERDIKILKKTSSRSFRLVFAILASSFIVFLLIMAVINLYICSRFALMEGFTISDVFLKWTEGISPSKQYSGTLLIAIQRLQTALTQIALALFCGLILWFKQSASKRNARILTFIEKNKI
jgi:hypothetical protein